MHRSWFQLALVHRISRSSRILYAGTWQNFNICPSLFQRQIKLQTTGRDPPLSISGMLKSGFVAAFLAPPPQPLFSSMLSFIYFDHQANSVAICNTKWAHVKVQKKTFGPWALRQGWYLTLYKYASPPRVTMPNSVTLGQTMWVGKGAPKIGDTGAPPLGMGHGWPPRNKPLPKSSWISSLRPNLDPARCQALDTQ